jgi:hypothetical protein
MQHRRRAAKAPAGNTDLVGLARRIRQARNRGEFTSYCASIHVHSRKAYDLMAIADAVDAAPRSRAMTSIEGRAASHAATVAASRSGSRRGEGPAQVRWLRVIADQLGHADTRMTEKHCAHLAPSYVADTVRAALQPLGILSESSVVTLLTAAAAR